MPDYVDLHWGQKPPHATLVAVKSATGSVRQLGEVRAISYVTDKGEARDVYRHVFDKHDGRGPYLYEAVDGEGDARLENPTPELVELGELVDLEMADGERIIVADAMIGTPRDGHDLAIVSAAGCPLQLEPRPDAHVVTPDGIEH